MPTSFKHHLSLTNPLYNGGNGGFHSSASNMHDAKSGQTDHVGEVTMENQNMDTIPLKSEEAVTQPKDPLHLAEAAEWTELGGVMLRRLRQLSVAMDEEVISPVHEISMVVETSEITDDINETTAGGMLQATTVQEDDDVWNEAATALVVATEGSAGLEVVDPDLDLDYIPRSPVVAQRSPTESEIGVMAASGEVYHHGGAEGGGSWLQYLHRHH